MAAFALISKPSIPRPTALKPLQRGKARSTLNWNLVADPHSEVRGSEATIQNRLTVSEPGDALEREADRVADQVTRSPELATNTSLLASRAAPTLSIQPIQRTCAACANERHEDKEELVQRAAPKAASIGPGSDFSHALFEARHVGGVPLPAPLRASMEQAFERDFGQVRVHDGTRADALAHNIQARAFTLGNDVFFRQGEFQPQSPSGKHLLAHELTHVVQQSRSAPTLQRQEETASDPEFEAPGPCADVPSTQPTIRRGSVAPAVREAQRKLNRFHELDQAVGGVGLPSAPLVPDCIFGPLTQAATLAFQARAFPNQPVEHDGIIGPKTWQKLENPGAVVGGESSFCLVLPASTDSTVLRALLVGGFQRLDDVLPSTATGEARLASFIDGDITGGDRIVLCQTPGGELVLPEPKQPTDPVGPIPGPDAGIEFCKPIADRLDALIMRGLVRAEMQQFIRIAFGDRDVENLWLTYLDTPKRGVRGTLPPRRLFSNRNSRIVREFANDIETRLQQTRIVRLIGQRVPGAGLLPPEGQETEPIPFRRILGSSDLLDLPMDFSGDPTSEIPSLIAGGHAKNASDAGDDVRNVDGRFVVFNMGFDSFRVRAFLVFDVFDAIDFCPGAPGSLLAQIAVTQTMSRLEATPNVPTYDTPFEVLYTTFEEQFF